MLVSIDGVERRAISEIKKSVQETTKFARKAFRKQYITSAPPGVTHHQLRKNSSYVTTITRIDSGYVGIVSPIASPHESIVDRYRYHVQWGSLAYMFETGNRYDLKSREKSPAIKVQPKVQKEANKHLRSALKNNLKSAGFSF